MSASLANTERACADRKAPWSCGATRSVATTAAAIHRDMGVGLEMGALAALEAIERALAQG